jgi:hypothetical protein
VATKLSRPRSKPAPVTLGPEDQLKRLLADWRRREGRLPTLAEVSAAMGWAPEEARRRAAALGACRPDKGTDDRAPARPEQGPEQKEAAGPPADRLARAAWYALRREGHTPTEAAVRGRVATWAESKAARKARAERARQLVEADGARAAEWVRGWRAEHGEGPLWSELCAAMGWPRRAGEAAIRVLREDGWVTFTKETRSLDVPCGAGHQPGAGADGTVL